MCIYPMHDCWYNQNKAKPNKHCAYFMGYIMVLDGSKQLKRVQNIIISQNYRMEILLLCK